MGHEHIKSLINKIDQLYENFINKSELPQIELDLLLATTIQLYDEFLGLRENNQDYTSKENQEKISTEIRSQQERKIETRLSLDVTNIEMPIESSANQVAISDYAHVAIEQPLDKKEKAAKATINDLIGSKRRKKTLAEKHEHAAIKDLKDAIGVNQKYTFLNELFKGDVNEYAEAINYLNKCEDLSQAENYINTYLNEKYNWSVKTNKLLVSEFKDLITRRFL